MGGEGYVTATGRVLTDADIQALADEAEGGYDVSQFKSGEWRRQGAKMWARALSEFERAMCRGSEVVVLGYADDRQWALVRPVDAAPDDEPWQATADELSPVTAERKPRLENYRTVIRLEGEWVSAGEANSKLRDLVPLLAEAGFTFEAVRTARVVDEDTMFTLDADPVLDPDV